MNKLVGRDMKDSAFSVERLLIWAVGVVMLIGMSTMATLAIQRKTIPPQIQSATMFCIGAFAARIEKKTK